MVETNQQKNGFAQEILSKYFGDEYLFDQANTFFREKVSPKDTTGLQAPPTITCASLLRFADCTVDDKNIASLCEAAASHPIVEALKEDGAVWCLRRRHFLNPKDDPALRSVVVWPLHRASTPEEVVDFFKSYGTVEKATAMMRPQGDTQPYVSFLVCFATVREAVACTKADISFGKAPSALAQHFLPSRLHVTSLETHLTKVAERSRIKDDAQLQHNVVKAQRALAELQESGVRRFLSKGVTLKVEGVSPGTTWQTIKMKLGNLSLSNPGLKKGITLVKVDEPCAGSPSKKLRAFVVCRDKATANELRSCFNLAEGEFARDLREVCPTLLQLTDAEEEYAQHHFPQWCKPRVEAKQADNRKRLRHD